MLTLSKPRNVAESVSRRGDPFCRVGCEAPLLAEVAVIPGHGCGGESGWTPIPNRWSRNWQGKAEESPGEDGYVRPSKAHHKKARWQTAGLDVLEDN
jgi:hypothetical protein